MEPLKKAMEPVYKFVGVGGRSPAKPSSYFGRAVSWIKGYNTYIPGISFVTSLGKVVAGALLAGFGVLRIGLGSIEGGLSIIAPKEQWSERLRKYSGTNLSEGAQEILAGIRGIIRAAISAVPVAGNGVIFGADKLSGLARKEDIADPIYLSMQKTIKEIGEKTKKRNEPWRLV